ncbi:MAG: LLM class flavin-dependent oxidoreductase [Actinobacteria bacterium]|nr:LLM class flavin-dependent oxidoreductase [Actinomycetota bacterium]
MIFGTFIPQGWKMELVDIADARDKWAATVNIAKRADELGYDSVWVYDHFHNVPVPAQEAMFECWTTLAAISQVTSTVRLGQMVSCSPYRNPALTAKITSTLDVISGGRLDFGVGAGWYDQEFRAYGYEYPSNRDRLTMLREAIEITKLMWTEPQASYEGRIHSVFQAECDPKPLQKLPPIWVGGGGEKVTLRIVAEHADRSNFGGKPDEFAHKCEVLKAHCGEVGRDYDEIIKTWSPSLFIRENAADLPTKSLGAWDEPLDSWMAGNLIGTPEQVIEKLKAYEALGLGGVVPWICDLPGTETLELFATQVMPEFSRG